MLFRHDNILSMDARRSRKIVTLYSIALRKLLDQRDKLNQKIEHTAELISANANFLPEEERAAQLQRLAEMVAGPPGFTDSVRNVLRNIPSEAVTARKVRDLLRGAGFDLSSYTNPLASIHTILKRLTEREEVVAGESNGEVHYRWNATAPE
jgi:hypothetical protein